MEMATATKGEEPMKKRLGRSQQAVISYMKDNCPTTAARVGDALYAKTSSCARYGDGTGSMGGSASPSEIRANWAAKVLNELKKRGLVDVVFIENKRHWSATDAGKEYW